MAAISAGNYIIRSALDEELVLQQGGSKAKNAAVSTSGLTESDNRCYFSVAAVTVSGAAMARISSLQAGTSAGNLCVAAVSAGQKLVQGAYKAATGAWDLAEAGTMTVEGRTLTTYFIRPAGDSSLCLTVPEGGGQPVLAALLDDTARQEFAFEPSTYFNPKLAAPAANTMRTSADVPLVIASGTTTFLPMWTSSSNAVIYEIRHRSRLYDMDGDPGDWTDFTAWEMAVCEARKNEKKKFTGAICSLTPIATPAGVNNQDYSQAEIQVQARLTSAKTAAAYSRTGKVTHGPTMAGSVNQYCRPSLTLSAAVYSPDGLALTYATDYTIRGGKLRINCIRSASGAVLIEDYDFTELDNSGEVWLNSDELNSLPVQNETLTVTATLFERDPAVSRTVTVQLTCVFDGDSGMQIDPVYALTDRLTVRASITSYATVELYQAVTQLDGRVRWVAADRISDDGQTAVFEFAPPYGERPDLLWVCVDEDGGWNSSVVQLPAACVVRSKLYSWYWIGADGSPCAAFLRYRAGQIMQPADTITLPATKFTTTGREYPVFRYTKSVSRDLSVEGAILDTEEGAWATREDFERMAVSGHAVYRQPNGRWYQVAVKRLNFVKNRRYCTVAVSQEAETR